MGEQGFDDLGRPQDDDVIGIEEALIRQERSVRDANAHVAALILAAVRTDFAGGGDLATLLPREVRFGDMVGLRILATVHRLALERVAPSVALHLPTLGGLPPTPELAPAFAEGVVRALCDNPVSLLAGLAQTPQTNETGRSALLRIALSRLGTDLPVLLNEIGASAGLNLRADHLPGDPQLEKAPLPTIAARRGCDLHPIDPTTADGRLTLTSYVWVDDVPRFDRLRNALDVAAGIHATLVRQDAASFVEELKVAEGSTTVLWHSAMWLYLPLDTKRRILAALSALGSSAESTRQLAHVSWEWQPNPEDLTMPFELVMRRWRGRPDDGVPIVVVRGHGHGHRLVDAGSQALPAEPLAH